MRLEGFEIISFPQVSSLTPQAYNHTSVLLGGQSASKTDGRGSNPRTRAFADVARFRRHRSCKAAHAGANPVVGS